MPKLERIVKDAEFTEIKEDAVPAEGQSLINLDDVNFMVMVGRYKDGSPFVVQVNTPDAFTVYGLLAYGEEYVRGLWREGQSSRGEV